MSEKICKIMFYGMLELWKGTKINNSFSSAQAEQISPHAPLHRRVLLVNM